MSKVDDAKKIAVTVSTLWDKYAEVIRDKKKSAERRWQEIIEGEHSYWLWDALVQSFATNGGARHWDNVSFLKSHFVSRGYGDPFSWPAMIGYSEKERSDWLSVAANPHFQRWESNRGWLVKFVAGYGAEDILARTQDGFATKTRDSCLASLKTIDGVSEKYARNLMMDVGHPEFMDNSFALDSRIGNFLGELTNRKHTYSAKSNEMWTELELVSIAHGLAMTAWEMDRLLFWFGKEVISASRTEKRQLR